MLNPETASTLDRRLECGALPDKLVGIVSGTSSPVGPPMGAGRPIAPPALLRGSASATALPACVPRTPPPAGEPSRASVRLLDGRLHGRHPLSTAFCFLLARAGARSRRATVALLPPSVQPCSAGALCNCLWWTLPLPPAAAGCCCRPLLLPAAAARVCAWSCCCSWRCSGRLLACCARSALQLALLVCAAAGAAASSPAPWVTHFGHHQGPCSLLELAGVEDGIYGGDACGLPSQMKFDQPQDQPARIHICCLCAHTGTEACTCPGSVRARCARTRHKMAVTWLLDCAPAPVRARLSCTWPFKCAGDHGRHAD